MSEADKYAGIWHALVRSQTSEERAIIRVAFGRRHNDGVDKDDREVLDDMARENLDEAERERLDDELEGMLRGRAKPQALFVNVGLGKMTSPAGTISDEAITRMDEDYRRRLRGDD